MIIPKRKSPVGLLSCILAQKHSPYPMVSQPLPVLALVAGSLPRTQLMIFEHPPHRQRGLCFSESPSFLLEFSVPAKNYWEDGPFRCRVFPKDFMMPVMTLWLLYVTINKQWQFHQLLLSISFYWVSSLGKTELQGVDSASFVFDYSSQRVDHPVFLFSHNFFQL